MLLAGDGVTVIHHATYQRDWPPWIAVLVVIAVAAVFGLLGWLWARRS